MPQRLKNQLHLILELKYIQCLLYAITYLCRASMPFNFIGKLTTLFICTCSITLSANAANYYVDVNNGVDGAGTSGGVDSPFETVSYALQKVVAGDTVLLQSGRYREVVNLGNIAGTADNPITIKPADGAEVIFDGSDEITGAWTPYPENNNIYQLTIDKNIWQLWQEDIPLTLARFPNAAAWTQDMFARYTGRRKEGPTSINGTMVDTGDDSINTPLKDAAPGESLNDTIAVMNLRNWNSYARYVEDHAPNSSTFNYDNTKIFHIPGHGAYFLEGGKKDKGLLLLDAPGEWTITEADIDGDAATLYYWPLDGKDPSDKTIHGKYRSYAFTGDNTTRHVTIEGLKFFGTTINFFQSENISIISNEFEYPSFSKRALGSLEEPEPTSISGDKSDDAKNNLIYDNTFKYLDGPAIYFRFSKNTVIDNNLFYMVDYGAIGTGFALNGNDVHGPVYRFNTLDMSGDSEGFRVGMNDQDADFSPATVEFNYHSRNGLQQTDGASVQYSPSAPTGSINRYNWFINNDRTGFRFDGDPAGNEGSVYKNVGIGELQRTFRLKGDKHKIYNNTSSGISGFFNVATEKGGVYNNGDGNARSTVYNNLADLITNWPLPGTTADNFNAHDSGTTTELLLRDPKNLDFRPQESSPLIGVATVVSGVTDTRPKLTSRTSPTAPEFETFTNSAPNIGAYQQGEAFYWIPGRQEAYASHHIPVDKAQNVKLNADLMWRVAKAADSYTVHLGKNRNDLSELGTVANNIFTPSSQFEENTVYYWRVDTTLDGNIHTGEITMFDTSVYSIEVPNITVSKDTFAVGTNAATNGTQKALQYQNGTTAYFGFTIPTLQQGLSIESISLVTRARSDSANAEAYLATGTWAESDSTVDLTIGSTPLDSVSDIINGNEVSFDISEGITDAGDYTIAITSNNSSKVVFHSKETGSRAAYVTYTLKGSATNTAPFFKSNSFTLTNAHANREYFLDISYRATDLEDQAELIFELENIHPWLTLSADGIFSGTPTDTDLGKTNLGIAVKDPYNASANTFMSIETFGASQFINVAPEAVSPAPLLPNAVINEAYQLNARAFVIDNNADRLRYSLSNAPEWLSISVDGVLRGTPITPGKVTFTLIAIDPDDAQWSGEIELMVDGEQVSNTSPVFTDGKAIAQAQENSAYVQSISDFASDADSDALTYTLSNAPAWLTLNGSNELVGTPTASDVSTSQITLSVTDGVNVAIEQNYTITVTEKSATSGEPAEPTTPSEPEEPTTPSEQASSGGSISTISVLYIIICFAWRFRLMVYRK